MRKPLFFLLAMIVVLGLSRPAMAVLIDKGLFAYDDGASNTGLVNVIYDSDFDISWVGDGKFAQTTGFDANSMMNWDASVAWAGGLTIGGFTDWRLPTALNQDGSGPFSGFHDPPTTIITSEMAHLFYDVLGGTANNPISGSGDPDLVFFPNLQDSFYWSGTELVPGGGWAFGFDVGNQAVGPKSTNLFALAVHDGDVGAAEIIPEPTTIALLGIGLVGLAGGVVRRRFKRTKKEVI